jgi:hypothetical protein
MSQIKEFRTAHEAIDNAKKSQFGVAILRDGKYLVVNIDEAESLRDSATEFAYLCYHKGHIVAVPVND